MPLRLQPPQFIQKIAGVLRQSRQHRPTDDGGGREGRSWGRAGGCGLARARLLGPRGPLLSAKFLSPVGFIAPAQSASRPLPLANPFRHFPNGSNPKRLKSTRHNRARQSSPRR